MDTQDWQTRLAYLEERKEILEKEAQRQFARFAEAQNALKTTEADLADYRKQLWLERKIEVAGWVAAKWRGDRRGGNRSIDRRKR